MNDVAGWSRRDRCVFRSIEDRCSDGGLNGGRSGDTRRATEELEQLERELVDLATKRARDLGGALLARIESSEQHLE